MWISLRGAGQYKQAIRIDPDKAKAHFGLGLAYFNLGMYKEAIASYKQGIRINPDDADAHLGLGLAYGNSGMYKEAIESFKQAIRINLDNERAHFLLGYALEQYEILKSLDSEQANKLFNLIYEQLVDSKES